MPQRRLIQEPVKVTGDVQYPKTGVTNLGDKLIHGATVASGLEPQEPGDLASLIGALVGMGLPLGAAAMNRGDRILRRAVPQWSKDGQVMREIEAYKQRPVPGSMAEFQPKPEGNSMSDLPPEEINKAIDLTRPPKRRTPDGK